MNKRVLVLVEGQTEERFVKDLLAPYFWEYDVYLSPTLLITKRVKDGSNFKGGITNFAKFKNDILRLLDSSGAALVTTIIDYYGLPTDFPGMRDRPAGTPLDRVRHVELAIHRHFGCPNNLIPFLALHEFETWLFCSPEELPKAIPDLNQQDTFARIRQRVRSPEEINDHPEYAPSKQIQRLFPAYKKTLHGPVVAKRIGLSKIRSECPHFDHWFTRLRSLATGTP